MALIFHALRLAYFYKTTTVSGDAYFGLLGVIISQLALQAMAVAFGILLLLGIAQVISVRRPCTVRQTSPLNLRYRISDSLTSFSCDNYISSAAMKWKLIW